MSIKLKAFIFAAAMVIAAAFASYSVITFGAVTDRVSTASARELVEYDFFTSTTTSATSTDTTDGTGAFRIAGALKAVFIFARGNIAPGNTGSSKFSVEVSKDAVTWYDFNKLITNDASRTGTSTITIPAGTTTALAAMELEDDAWQFVRCIVEEVADGSHSCSVNAEF